MPTITLDKQDVLKLIGKKLSDKQLNDNIPMVGTDLENISKKEIKVEIFPNRPDMITEEGFARALSSFMGIKTGIRQYKVNPSSYRFKIDQKVKKIRPSVAAAVIKGIKMNDATIKSIMDMQEKLTLTHGRNRKKVAIGIHNLKAMTFPLTYTTKPKHFRFIPLGSNQLYDLDQILENHPKGQEFGHILENYKEYPIWIDAKGQVLSMPPVINAEETKLTPQTTDVFLDITGTNQQAVEQALNIIVASLVDRGGKIYKVNNFPDMHPKKIKIDLKYFNKRLGLNLTPPQAKKLLEKMGMTMQGLTVYYPAYRADILHQVDIMEDLAIAYGYDNFKPEIPQISTIAQEHPFEKFKNKIAHIALGLNLTETSTYHIINKESQTSKMNHPHDPIELMNPISREYNSLRTWITPSLMEILQANKHNEFPQRIFEMGNVFTKKGKTIHEATRMAILISNTNVDYTHIKQILDAICSNLNLKYSTQTTDHPSFIPGRGARISIKGKSLAYMGEIHPQVLENFELDMPVTTLEINLTNIYALLNR